MVDLIGISGSLRAGSLNTGLLRAATALVPDGVTLTIGAIDAIPLYNGDVEARDGIPAAVETLKDQIAAGDGLILATPEYNNAIPGVLKNAVDWLTRPPDDIGRVFRGKPVALMGATPGGFGTTLAQTAWLPVLRTLGTEPWFGARMLVARAGDAFDAAGTLSDDDVSERLGDYLAGFADFVRARRADGT